MKKFCKYAVEIVWLGTLLVGGISCSPSSLGVQSDSSVSVLSETDEQQLVHQMNTALWQAETLIQAGKVRWQEHRPVEARDEFERALLLLDQGVGQRLDQVNQVSVQSGVGSLSPQISAIMMRQRQAEQDIDHWLEVLEKELRQMEKVEGVLQQNRTVFQAITPPTKLPDRVTSSYSSFRPDRSYGEEISVEENIERNIEELRRKGDIFRQALLRANSLFPHVTSILSAEGVPGFLAYVALLESGFQPEARSFSGQAGLWQFSPSLARQYGLTVNTTYDERLQLHASTRAFARYISRLYRQHGNWLEAIAALSTDLNYLARVIAANRIANDPRQYGLYVDLHNMTGRYDVLREGSRLQYFSEPEFGGPPIYQ